MKRFLFVISLTPEKLLSPFRADLAAISLDSLRQQTSSDWSAVLLGEHNRDDGDFHYMDLGGVRKEQKLHHFADWLMKQQQQPEYIIRFDDDDLFHPQALQQVSALDFDCYADRRHWFYDSSSGRCASQERSWLPNTVIHRTAHAMAAYGKYHERFPFNDRLPVLLENDHSVAWHAYYKDKNVLSPAEGHPLYLRILSPQSITSEANRDYKNYLTKFGDWRERIPGEYQSCTDRIAESWIRHYGKHRRYFFSPFRYWRYKLSGAIGKLGN